jgi:hypothetical protein
MADISELRMKQSDNFFPILKQSKIPSARVTSASDMLLNLNPRHSLLQPLFFLRIKPANVGERLDEHRIL